MARRKKPENESENQEYERKIAEKISNSFSRSEKTSWNRKMDNMVTLLASLQPIEEKIVELQAKKIPIIDQVNVLRQKMVTECIHPFEYLVVKDDHVICKFCNKKMSLPDEL